MLTPQPLSSASARPLLVAGRAQTRIGPTEKATLVAAASTADCRLPTMDFGWLASSSGDAAGTGVRVHQQAAAYSAGRVVAQGRAALSSPPRFLYLNKSAPTYASKWVTEPVSELRCPNSGRGWPGAELLVLLCLLNHQHRSAFQQIALFGQGDEFLLELLDFVAFTPAGRPEGVCGRAWCLCRAIRSVAVGGWLVGPRRECPAAHASRYSFAFARRVNHAADWATHRGDAAE